MEHLIKDYIIFRYEEINYIIFTNLLMISQKYKIKIRYNNNLNIKREYRN